MELFELAEKQARLKKLESSGQRFSDEWKVLKKAVERKQMELLPLMTILLFGQKPTKCASTFERSPATKEGIVSRRRKLKVVLEFPIEEWPSDFFPEKIER